MEEEERPIHPNLARAVPSLSAFAHKEKNSSAAANRKNITEDPRHLMQVFQAQKDEHEREISKLEREYSEKLKRNQQQKLEFERQIKLDTEKIAKQQAKIEELSQKGKNEEDLDYKTTHRDLKSEVEALELQRDQAERRVNELTLELTRSQQKLKETREMVKSLPHAKCIEDMQIEKRKMERARDTEIAKLKTSIETSEARIAELETELDQSVRESEALQEENVRLTAEMDKIEAAIKGMRTDCANLRRQIEQNGPMIPFEHVKMRIAQMEEKKRDTIARRKAELQEKYEQDVEHRNNLEEELKRRLQIIEELNEKVNELTQQAVDAKTNTEREIQRLKRVHQRDVAELRERLNSELESTLEEQRRRMTSAAELARNTGQ